MVNIKPMEHIHSADRHQIAMNSLDDLIEQDNAVRFVDAFVNQLDLSQLSFKTKTIKAEGRPSYNSKIFLKRYFMATSMAYAAAAD